MHDASRDIVRGVREQEYRWSLGAERVVYANDATCCDEYDARSSM